MIRTSMVGGISFVGMNSFILCFDCVTAIPDCWLNMIFPHFFDFLIKELLVCWLFFFTNVCLICRLGRQFGRKWLLEWERPRGQSGPSSLLVPIPAPERGNPKHLLHRNPSPEHPGFAESCRRKCPPPWEATEHWEK